MRPIFMPYSPGDPQFIRTILAVAELLPLSYLVVMIPQQKALDEPICTMEGHSPICIRN